MKPSEILSRGLGDSSLEMELLPQAACYLSGVNLSADHFRRCKDLLQLLHANTHKGSPPELGRGKKEDSRQEPKPWKQRRRNHPQALSQNGAERNPTHPKGPRQLSGMSCPRGINKWPSFDCFFIYNKFLLNIFLKVQANVENSYFLKNW